MTRAEFIDLIHDNMGSGDLSDFIDELAGKVEGIEETSDILSPEDVTAFAELLADRLFDPE